jgi:hypothetical protein
MRLMDSCLYAICSLNTNFMNSQLYAIDYHKYRYVKLIIAL